MAQPNTATSEDPKVLPVRASEGWGFFECWCVTRSTHGDTIYSYLDAMRRLIVALEDLEAHKSLKKVVICLFLCGARTLQHWQVKLLIEDRQALQGLYFELSGLRLSPRAFTQYFLDFLNLLFRL
ncbi:hypothetical protein L208DRAFT_146330 [Tricholoma matsutake]|nr:hypothetical protein L208DRAFT_146330 [Tricholoma matsutake 945]